jgi:hypothetical protein
MNVRRAVLCCAALTLTIGGLACSPETDIVATNTEHVGPYELTPPATPNATDFAGRACVADNDSAAAVADRVHQQLTNHSYRSVTIDVYSAGWSKTPNEPLGRFVWSGGTLTRGTAPPVANVCADKPNRFRPPAVH